MGPKKDFNYLHQISKQKSDVIFMKTSLDKCNEGFKM